MFERFKELYSKTHIKVKSCLADKLFYRKIVALACLITLLSSNVSMFHTTIQNGSIGMVGANKALGSPLLDSTFNPEEFQPLETAVFGIFLSNFPLMLIDDYASAFSTGNGGSNGYGYKALAFGSGGSTVEATLQNLLNYVISTTQQSNFYKPIYYTTKDMEGTIVGGFNPAEDTSNSTSSEPAFKRQATLADLVYLDVSVHGGSPQSTNWWDNLHNTASEALRIQGDGPAERDPSYNSGKDAYATVNVMGNPNSIYTSYYVTDSSTAKEFFIHPNNGTDSRETIFNHFDGYDMSMLIAQLGRMYTGVGKDYSELFIANMEKYIAHEEAYLFFDVFGNIVMKCPDTGRYLMVYPACANQYLTEKRSYNLLSAPLVGASYMDASGYSYMTDLETDKNGGEYPNGVSPIGNPSTKIKGHDGSLLLYFDSDTWSEEPYGLHMGQSLVDLFDAAISPNNTSQSKLKIDSSSLSRSGYLSGVSFFYHASRMGISDLSNTLMTLNAFGEGDRLPLFENPVIVLPNHWSEGMLSGKLYQYNQNRQLTNFVYELYNGSISNPGTLYTGLAGITSSSISSSLSQCESGDDVREYILGGQSSPSDFAYGFAIKSGDNGKASSVGGLGYNWLANTGTSYNRYLKVYQRGATMRCVNQVLGVGTDAEFAIWTPKIYYTYLEWYGLIGTKNNKLKPTLFEPNNFNIDHSAIVTSSITNDDMKRMIYTYMDPNGGRDLRKSLFENLISDLIYDSYTKIVYSTKNVASGNVATVNNTTGFLNINAYADNPFTAWVLSNYAEIMIVALTLGIVLILVVGIIMHRGIGWMTITIVCVINAILIIPSLGETVPYFANKVQLQIFNKRLDYWAVSEIVQNTKIEKELYATQTNDITNEVMALAKSFNSSFLDRSLMLRYDISRKVTETGSYDLGELQKFQTTRWLLPSIVKQYSGHNNSESYVFISMSEALDNARSLYWMYEPADKLATVDTAADTEGTFKGLTSSERYSNYRGYIDNKNQGYEGECTKVVDNPTHQSFYFIPGVTIPDVDLNAGDQAIISAIEGTGSELESISTLIQTQAGRLSSLDSSSIQPIYGYLWNSESPLTYMYLAVKDSFPVEETLGGVVTELQGLYKAAEESGDKDENYEGEEVRTSFMHYERTELIRDVVNMEEFFTNMLPYMYTVQIMAGGLDGESGYFGDEMISEYDIYVDNKVSWLFRCNWATKLVESKELTEPETIMSHGVKYTIENPLSPETYPIERPMIFSEAQMFEEELTPDELTQVELLILKMNENIVDRWTLLINYVNMHGMTKEVLYKEMALIAVTEFNKTFAPSGWYNERLALYPTSVELRNISFDAVMRMLMLNATRNSGDVYGDVMVTLIANSDILSATLLLVVAFVCVTVMPLCVNLLMAILFYLGIYSTLINILSSTKTRFVSMGAYMINILMFIIINVIYYTLISFLMGLSSPTDVLNVGINVIDIKSPSIILLLLLALSLVYLWAVWKLFWLIFRNPKDMGANVFIGVADSIGSKISETMSKIGDKIRNAPNGAGQMVGYAGSAAQNSWAAMRKQMESRQQAPPQPKQPRQQPQEPPDEIESGYKNRKEKRTEDRNASDQELKDSSAINKEIAKGKDKE